LATEIEEVIQQMKQKEDRVLARIQELEGEIGGREDPVGHPVLEARVKELEEMFANFGKGAAGTL
jgi:hypothetical protein